MSVVLRREGLLREATSDGVRVPSVGEWDGSVSRHFRWQGWWSRILAATLLVPALPLIGLLVALVRLTSRGPGIYRQTRVGLEGRIYTVYKIRTMHEDAEAETGPVWTQHQDPRITAVGRVLRALHLDEFPQLFNVLKGEMALVGPRPERPEFTQILAREIPGYLHRLAVRPGITGLAQINLPPDTDLDSVRRKLAADLEYIREAGTLLDVRILLCTFLRLVGFRGYLTAELLGLQPKVLREEKPAAVFSGNGRSGAEAHVKGRKTSRESLDAR